MIVERPNTQQYSNRQAHASFVAAQQQINSRLLNTRSGVRPPAGLSSVAIQGCITQRKESLWAQKNPYSPKPAPQKDSARSPKKQVESFLAMSRRSRTSNRNAALTAFEQSKLGTDRITTLSNRFGNDLAANTNAQTFDSSTMSSNRQFQTSSMVRSRTQEKGRINKFVNLKRFVQKPIFELVCTNPESFMLCTPQSTLLRNYETQRAEVSEMFNSDEELSTRSNKPSIKQMTKGSTTAKRINGTQTALHNRHNENSLDYKSKDLNIRQSLDPDAINSAEKIRIDDNTQDIGILKKNILPNVKNFRQKKNHQTKTIEDTQNDDLNKSLMKGKKSKSFAKYKQTFAGISNAVSQCNDLILLSDRKREYLESVRPKSVFETQLKQDYKAVLNEANAQLKIMTQQCKRLIPEGKLNADHELVDGKNNVVQLIPDFLMNYKVKCQNRPSPCKISIEYPTGTPESIRRSVDVYFSHTATSPNDDNNDLHKKGPKSLTINPKSQEINFGQQPCFYLSFQSPFQLALHIKIEFRDLSEEEIKLAKEMENMNPLERKKTMQKLKQQETQKEAEKSLPPTQSYDSEKFLEKPHLDPLFYLRQKNKEREAMVYKKNFIQKNIQKYPISPRIKMTEPQMPPSVINQMIDENDLNKDQLLENESPFDSKFASESQLGQPQTSARYKSNMSARKRVVPKRSGKITFGIQRTSFGASNTTDGEIKEVDLQAF